MFQDYAERSRPSLTPAHAPPPSTLPGKNFVLCVGREEKESGREGAEVGSGWGWREGVTCGGDIGEWSNEAQKRVDVIGLTYSPFFSSSTPAWVGCVGLGVHVPFLWLQYCVRACYIFGLSLCSCESFSRDIIILRGFTFFLSSFNNRVFISSTSYTLWTIVPHPASHANMGKKTSRE